MKEFLLYALVIRHQNCNCGILTWSLGKGDTELFYARAPRIILPLDQ